MKKVLLFSLFFLISALCVFAYETVIVNFPDGENWEKVGQGVVVSPSATYKLDV